MPEISILTEADLRRLVPLDRDAIDCIEGAFRAFAEGGVIMPPVLHLDIPARRGEIDVKTAFVPDLPDFAIKMSPGFFDNPSLGLPSTSGLMVAFDARTGFVRRLLLDNGYLTDVRTAAAGAVAARYLARADASIAAIFGAGMQARLQLEALALVRPIRSARIWARRPERAAALAADIAAHLAIEAVPCRDPAQAVRGAHVIVTTTPAQTPILFDRWIEPGQHITAMGSDSAHKNEIEPALIARADRYVADSLSQTGLIGELRSAVAAGRAGDGRHFAELGAIMVESAEGRGSDTEITVADLTGIGAQDTAIAFLAGRRADEAGAGVGFES
ncbi:MAG TPA: ectoine utilization protein EutC [Acidiphilium sp.]